MPSVKSVHVPIATDKISIRGTGAKTKIPSVKSGSKKSQAEAKRR